jgi:hypothetical protein
MWVFSTDGFFSAVRDNLAPGHILVRFRDPAHAERIRALAYPGRRGIKPDIRQTPAADYRWKVSMPHGRFNVLLAKISDEVMAYDNFKKECHLAHPDDDLHHLHDVWSVMHRVQQTRERKRAVQAAGPAYDWQAEAQADAVPSPAELAEEARQATKGKRGSRKGQKRQEREEGERHTYGPYPDADRHDSELLTAEEIERLSRP